MSVFRAYLINAETGAEMTGHPLNGKQWLGTSGNYHDGHKFIRGTASRVTVADYADLKTIRNEVAITPDQFDHPVVVKIWGPDHQDWRYLIDDKDVLTNIDRDRAQRCEERTTA